MCKGQGGVQGVRVCKGCGCARDKEVCKGCGCARGECGRAVGGLWEE